MPYSLADGWITYGLLIQYWYWDRILGSGHRNPGLAKNQQARPTDIFHLCIVVHKWTGVKPMLFPTCPASVLCWHIVGTQIPSDLTKLELGSGLCFSREWHFKDSYPKRCLQTEVWQSHNIINLLLCWKSSSGNFARLCLAKYRRTDSWKQGTRCPLGESHRVSTFPAKWKRWSNYLGSSGKMSAFFRISFLV